MRPFKAQQHSSLPKALVSIIFAGLLSLFLCAPTSIASANETFKNVLQQAEAGNVKAQYTAGYVYHMGQKEFPEASIKFSPVKAYTWYLICLRSLPPESSLSKVTRLYMTVLKQEMSEKQLKKAMIRANKWQPKKLPQTRAKQ